MCCAGSVSAQSADSLRLDYNCINSAPQNAEVYIDDDLIGNTPLYFIWGDSAFPKQIKLSLKGYADFIEQVVNPAQMKKTYTLIPFKGTVTKSQVRENKNLYFDKPRKIIPIIASSLFALTAGASAYHFKSLAIDNRVIYELTGDQEALDNEKKYDLISGISVIVFQAGLVALIYFLLID